MHENLPCICAFGFYNNNNNSTYQHKFSNLKFLQKTEALSICRCINPLS